MFRILLLLFLLIPVIEIYLLIEVGGLIGALPTVFLVIFTAVLGALLLRWQGFSTMRRVRAMMARGEVPAVEMLEGVILLMCGVMLLTPGFFTDALGFAGLVPVLRRSVILWFLQKGLIVGVGGGRAESPPSHTIEGEFWRHDDRHR